MFRRAKPIMTFGGLDLRMEVSSDFDTMLEASNCFIRGGKALPRLGRRELTKAQVDTQRILGAAFYVTPDNKTTQVVVRADGIYQRVENA